VKSLIRLACTAEPRARACVSGASQSQDLKHLLTCVDDWLLARMTQCLLKIDTRCNVTVKSWQAVDTHPATAPRAWLGSPVGAAGVSRRQEPEPKVKMRARHVTTNPHPRPTLPCSQTSAESAVLCIVLLFGWTGRVASWLITARSDHDRPPAPRFHPVNATLAGAGYGYGYGYGPTSLTGSQFEFDANGRSRYTTL